MARTKQTFRRNAFQQWRLGDFSPLPSGPYQEESGNPNEAGDKAQSPQEAPPHVNNSPGTMGNVHVCDGSSETETTSDPTDRTTTPTLHEEIAVSNEESAVANEETTCTLDPTDRSTKNVSTSDSNKSSISDAERRAMKLESDQGWKRDQGFGDDGMRVKELVFPVPELYQRLDHFSITHVIGFKPSFFSHTSTMSMSSRM